MTSEQNPNQLHPRSLIRPSRPSRRTATPQRARSPARSLTARAQVYPLPGEGEEPAAEGEAVGHTPAKTRIIRPDQACDLLGLPVGRCISQTPRTASETLLLLLHLASAPVSLTCIDPPSL